MKTKPFRRIRAAGFTLVEIMIGLLIGLIGIVVIMETYAVSEGYRRTTTSGTDAQVNGAIAMYLMHRELRDAGYNMQPYLNAGCTSVIVWYENLGKSRLVRFVPVEINPAGFNVGDPNTDVILIAYGNSDTAVIGMPGSQGTIVQSGATPDANAFKLRGNYTGYRTGDYLFSAMPSAGTVSCVLHEITNTPNPSANCGQTVPKVGSDLYLDHQSLQYPSFAQGCQKVQAIHNAAGGIKDQNNVPVPAVVNPPGQVFSMGPSPVAKIFAIRSGNLTVCESIAKDCTDPNNYDVLVNDIVSMRAILGGDYVGATPPPGDGLLGDGSIDQWSRNALNSASDARRTIAVAIELTARSGLKEKSSTGNPDPSTCDATTSKNLPDKAQTLDWYSPYTTIAAGSLTGAKIDLSQSDPQGQWKCYRYKMFQSVVTLRNLLWTPGGG